MAHHRILIGGSVETAGHYLSDRGTPWARWGAVEREFATVYSSRTAAYEARRQALRAGEHPGLKLKVEPIPPCLRCGSTLGDTTHPSGSWDGNPRCKNCGEY